MLVTQFSDCEAVGWLIGYTALPKGLAIPPGAQLRAEVQRCVCLPYFPAWLTCFLPHQVCHLSRLVGPWQMMDGGTHFHHSPTHPKG